MKNGIIVWKNQLGKIVKDYENPEKKRFLPCDSGTYSSSRLEEIVDMNDVREATKEEKWEFIKKEYHFGHIEATHEIGDYQIIESVRTTEVNGESKTEKLFHTYLDFNDMHESYYTLDEAIIGAIAGKYEGLNHRANRYFCRMIGLYDFYRKKGLYD